VVCKSKRPRKEEGVVRSLWDPMHQNRSGAECMCQCVRRRSVSRGLVRARGMRGRKAKCRIRPVGPGCANRLSQDIPVCIVHGSGAERIWACPAMSGVRFLVREL
jgi:hypothetical protein